MLYTQLNSRAMRHTAQLMCQDGTHFFCGTTLSNIYWVDRGNRGTRRIHDAEMMSS